MSGEPQEGKFSDKRGMRKLALLLALPLCFTAVSCSSTNATGDDEPVVAKIKTTPFIIADMQTTIVASESTGGDELIFSYDTDGDGEFENTPQTMDPSKLSWTFTEPGEQTISVRVENKDGESSVATTSFTVYPADYLNADKKSELSAIVKGTGNGARIDIKALPIDSTATLRVYLGGTNSSTAQPEDIKVYGPWSLKANENAGFDIKLDGLSNGKYQATVASSTGAEIDVSFTLG